MGKKGLEPGKRKNKGVCQPLFVFAQKAAIFFTLLAGFTGDTCFCAEEVGLAGLVGDIVPTGAGFGFDASEVEFVALEAAAELVDGVDGADGADDDASAEF